MRFYFIRHGQSEANVQRVIWNRAGAYPLTPLGRQQADALAETIRANGPIAQIYTSPIERAAQTAAILAGALGAPITPAPALAEFDCGVFEGRADPEAWAAYDRLVAAWTIHGRRAERLEGGECFDDLRARFVPFVNGLLQAPAPAGDVLLVSHGGVLRLMLPLVLANITPAFAYAPEHSLKNATAVSAELRGGALFCTHWGREVVGP